MSRKMERSKPVYDVDFTRRIIVRGHGGIGYDLIVYGHPPNVAMLAEPMRDNYRFDGVFNPHERHSRIDTDVVCLQGRIL